MEERVDRVTAAASTPRPATPRRARGAAESLASIVLAFEAVIAFLGGLAIFGLKATPDSIAPWWGIVAGTVVAVLMILTARLVRYPWGIALGWVLQLLVALGAFLVPALGLVALIFGGMYAYATIKGGALDKRNAILAANPTDPA
ncbi:DUF4233 domain-containing protein (plasmid) [Coraliomargarita sp. W4R53]